MSPVASLVTTDRCSNVSMCLRISTKCFLFPGIVPLLYSVGNKTYYYYYSSLVRIMATVMTIASNSPDELHPDLGRREKHVPRHDLRLRRRTMYSFDAIIFYLYPRSHWVRLLFSLTWRGAFRMTTCYTPVILDIFDRQRP